MTVFVTMISKDSEFPNKLSNEERNSCLTTVVFSNGQPRYEEELFVGEGRPQIHRLLRTDVTTEGESGRVDS